MWTEMFMWLYDDCVGGGKKKEVESDCDIEFQTDGSQQVLWYKIYI